MFSHIQQYLCLGITLSIVLICAITISVPIVLLKSKQSQKICKRTLNFHSQEKFCICFMISVKTVELRWNQSGITVASSLGAPYGFRLNRFNTLYIAESTRHRITKWLSGAINGTIVAGRPNGQAGNGSNEFSAPIDVYVDDNEDMYITDRYNDRLQYWSNGNSAGITIAGRIYCKK